MGCQQSRNTIPTEYFDQEDQNIPNNEEDQRVRNLFQNISNNYGGRGNCKQGVMNEQVPQAKGCGFNEVPTYGFTASGKSKKFNESRTLDLINNELFSHRNHQQSVRDSKKMSGQDKENGSILQEYRQIKLKKSLQMQSQQSMNQQQWKSMQQKCNNTQNQQQNSRNSIQSSNMSLSSALSSQLQLRFQSTLKDPKKQQRRECENDIQSYYENTQLQQQNRFNKQEKENPSVYQSQKLQVIESARQIMSIRSGKSFQICEEEYECILYMINDKILPEMERSGSPLMEFKREVILLLEQWGESVHSAVIEQTGEIRNYVSLRNTNDFIRITHDLSCWKNFSVLERFVTNVLKQPLNSQYLNFVKNNAQQIKALSCFIWIELQYQKDLNKLDVQIGLSERQPYDQRLLYSIIHNKNERNNIMDWYNIAQPIANEYGFIVNSQHIDEIYDFYIFENDERTNLNSSLQAFYNYGASFSTQLTQVLERIPGNDFHILFHLNRFGLLNLKISLQNVWQEEEFAIFDEITSTSQTYQNYKALRRVWESMNEIIFNEENIYTLHMIEFNPDGFYLYKTREISIDEDIHI